MGYSSIKPKELENFLDYFQRYNDSSVPQQEEMIKQLAELMGTKLIIAVKNIDDEQFKYNYSIKKHNGGVYREVTYFFDEKGHHKLGDYCDAIEEQSQFEIVCFIFDVCPDDVLEESYQKLKGKIGEEVTLKYEL